MPKFYPIENLDPLIQDGTPYVIGMGTFFDNHYTYAKDESGRQKVVAVHGLDGYILRLYGPYYRKRDGVLILKKVGDIELVIEVDPDVHGRRYEKKLKWLHDAAVKRGKQLAERYQWVFEKNARQYSKPPDLYEAYLDLTKVALG